MARLGERDPKRLAESALLEFGRPDLIPASQPKA
jgi:hypothetical protein